MLVMQNLARTTGTQIAGASIKTNPLCPNCGRPMHLARVAPRSEGLSDIHIFRCGECGVSLAQAADDHTAA
jgi:predicted RNA-binding Zn-ribbon protein involved in translation (DUF1610 family)